MSYSNQTTNIENYGGDCPDCEHLERQLNKERGRHQQDIKKLLELAEYVNTADFKYGANRARAKYLAKQAISNFNH